jgi:short-subunit dehydrogenase involved in D-alanine esterification of teichoic acids
LTRDDLTNVLNVNLLGAIEMTNMLYPLLRTAKGRVVNVSSPVALFPTAGTIYSVSKAGIEAFSDNIRLDSTFTVILFKREQLYHWMWKVTIIFILVQVTCMVELAIG